MGEKDEVEMWKKAFQIALNKLVESASLRRQFVGKITLNINNGGITAIDCLTTIR